MTKARRGVLDDKKWYAMSKTRWGVLDEKTKALMTKWMDDDGCPDPACKAEVGKAHVDGCTFVKWAMEEVKTDG